MPEVEVFVQIAGADVLAGRLYTNAARGAESSSFRYDPVYLSSPDAYPLDPALPLYTGATNTPSGKALFNAFSDSAPDRWGQNLMRRAEQNRADAAGVTGRTLLPSDFLLGSSDLLRQGALRYKTPGSSDFLTTDPPGVPRLVSLPDLIRSADSLGRDTATTSDIRDLLQAGGSLGGARPKAAVIDLDGTLGIAKFPKYQESDDWNVIGWEKTTLDIAGAAGIRAATGKLVPIGDRSTLVLPRFDRHHDQRIGYISALTALESSDGDTSLSYLDIVDWIEENSAAAAKDAQELWRRMAFSITVGNTDDHLRNHGFLRAPGGWRLAPAFDMNPTPGTGSKSLSTAVARNNNDADLGLALEVAELFSHTPDSARAALHDIAAAVDDWRGHALQNRLDSRDMTAIGPALDHGATRARQLSQRSGPPSAADRAAGGRARWSSGTRRGGQFMAKGQSAAEVTLTPGSDAGPTKEDFPSVPRGFSGS